MAALKAFLVIPEFLYMIFLLSSWIAAMFTGIAFVYGIHMKKEKKTITIWGSFFAVCLVFVFLLMNGYIVAGTMLGG